jgi:DNA-binding NarL/FixJ family response regulator
MGGTAHAFARCHNSAREEHVTTRDVAVTATRRRDWQAAYDAYTTIEDRTAADLEGLGEAAWWLGRMRESVEHHTEAYRGYCDDRDLRAASRTAFLLAVSTRLIGDPAASAGWVSRAERSLADLPEGAEHGYPLYLRIAQLMGSDLDSAAMAARRMQELGRRHDDPTLVALGVYYEGRVLIKREQVTDGLALLDEAMVAALSDELAPLWTGAIYCGLMDACNELRDMRRAHEWTLATTRWCDPLPLTSLYPGICRVHRAQVLQSRGSWAEAEQEALEACRDMAGVDVFAVADAYYEIAEVRRLRGDLAAAEKTYLDAHRHGRDPQPGLALVRLAQGRVDAAAAAVAAALAERTGTASRLGRAPLLSAQVDIALAADDMALADAAGDELAATAETFQSAGLRAEAHRCRGAVRLAQDLPVEGMGALRLALNAWHELDAPYEAARTRMLLAAAYRALGDAEAATREEDAARDTFDRLGVVVQQEDRPSGLTHREVEVVRLVAAGKSNRAIAEQLVLSEKTVARHVSNIFVKTGLGSRSAVTAFAYDSGLLGRTTQG